MKNRLRRFNVCLKEVASGEIREKGQQILLGAYPVTSVRFFFPYWQTSDFVLVSNPPPVTQRRLIGSLVLRVLSGLNKSLCCLSPCNSGILVRSRSQWISGKSCFDDLTKALESTELWQPPWDHQRCEANMLRMAKRKAWIPELLNQQIRKSPSSWLLVMRSNTFVKIIFKAISSQVSVT